MEKLNRAAKPAALFCFSVIKISNEKETSREFMQRKFLYQNTRAIVSKAEYIRDEKNGRKQLA